MYNLVSFSIISSNSRVCQQRFFNSLAFIFTGLVNYPNIFTGLMNYHKVPQLIPGIMCFLAVFCGLIWVGQVRGVLQRGSLTYIWNNLYSFKLSSVLRWILMKKRNLAGFSYSLFVDNCMKHSVSYDGPIWRETSLWWWLSVCWLFQALVVKQVHLWKDGIPYINLRALKIFQVV